MRTELLFFLAASACTPPQASDVAFSGSVNGTGFTAVGGRARPATPQGGLAIELLEQDIACDTPLIALPDGARMVTLGLNQAPETGSYRIVATANAEVWGTVSTLQRNAEGVPTPANLMLSDGTIRLDEVGGDEVVGYGEASAGQRAALAGNFKVQRCD